MHNQNAACRWRDRKGVRRWRDRIESSRLVTRSWASWRVQLGTLGACSKAHSRRSTERICASGMRTSIASGTTCDGEMPSDAGTPADSAVVAMKTIPAMMNEYCASTRRAWTPSRP